MTDEEITAIAHRTASKYSHRSDPTYIAYTFLPHTLLDFARKLIDAATLAERERCAKIVETQDTYGDHVGCWFETLAAKIRQEPAP